MDDKLFDLMTQMHGEVTKLREEVSAIGKSQMRFENDLKPKIVAALDGYTQVYEKLQEHDTRFDTLENKMQKQDVEIRVIKGGLNT